MNEPEDANRLCSNGGQVVEKNIALIVCYTISSTVWLGFYIETLFDCSKHILSEILFFDDLYNLLHDDTKDIPQYT